MRIANSPDKRTAVEESDLETKVVRKLEIRSGRSRRTHALPKFALGVPRRERHECSREKRALCNSQKDANLQRKASGGGGLEEEDVRRTART